MSNISFISINFPSTSTTSPSLSRSISELSFLSKNLTRIDTSFIPALILLTLISLAELVASDLKFSDVGLVTSEYCCIPSYTSSNCDWPSKVIFQHLFWPTLRIVVSIFNGSPALKTNSPLLMSLPLMLISTNSAVPLPVTKSAPSPQINEPDNGSTLQSSKSLGFFSDNGK